MDQHPPARAVSAHSTDRARRALDLLGPRGPSTESVPSEWESRIAPMAAQFAAAAVRVELPFAPTTDRTLASESPAGVVIDGFHPPDVALAAWRATSAGADGFRTPICIIQSDVVAFLAGCALCDDPAIYQDPRCRWFIGPDAGEQFAAFLASRIETSLPRHMLRAPGASVSPPVETLLKRAHDAQLAEHNALRSRAATTIDSRRVAARYESVLGDDGGSLRVLIPTTRYSTYVRHAAIDLAAALRAMGHTAITLEEPSTDARLASVAYLRAARDLKPDLIVSINYTRAQLRGALPDDVPMVCWVQDRMPHLFDRAMGAAQGPLDFLAGHIHPSLYLDFGYPRDRCMFRAVPASPRTFHTGPADVAHAAAMTCDVMYAGHQSESPDTMRDRLLPAFAGIPGLLDAARDIDAHLRALAAEGKLTAAALDKCTRDALTTRNIPLANARAVETFDTTYTRALAERIHRHQTLEWAADICRRRGWTLHIYGNGWDRHPTLSAHARPELDHAEDLRIAYRSARVALHASLASNAHQRIAECALSGGLMLRRGPNPEFTLIRKMALRAILASWGPGEPCFERGAARLRWVRDLTPDFDAPDWANPRALRLHSARGGTDHPAPKRNADGTYTTDYFCTSLDIERDLPRLPDIPLWTFPDYAYPHAETSAFCTAAQLEYTLERAITDPQWRDGVVSTHTAVARNWWTTDRFAADLLDFIALRLGASPTATGAAA